MMIEKDQHPAMPDVDESVPLRLLQPCTAGNTGPLYQRREGGCMTGIRKSVLPELT